MDEIIEIEQVLKRWEDLNIESGDKVLITSLVSAFHVKYTVAARTIDKLEKLGIVEYRDGKGWFKSK
jgi:predicted transcriptional regulator